MTVNTGGTAQDTIERLQAKIKELEAPVLPDDVAAAVMSDLKAINIVMDGPPGPDSQFIEVELDNGHGIKIGEWVEYGEYWALRIAPSEIVDITALSPVLPDDVAEIVEQLRGIRDLTILECGHNRYGDEWGKYDHECVNRGEAGADMLERQAREIEQLKAEHEKWDALASMENERLQVQVKELEAAQKGLIEIIERNAPEAMPAAAVVIGEARAALQENE